MTRAKHQPGLALYLAQVRALLWKDLLIEVRSKDVLLSTVVFGLLTLTVFIFSFELRGEDRLLVSPGVLWSALLFAGTLAMGRAYAQERERGSMEGLLLCPMDRSAVYVAKLAAALVYLSVSAAFILPVFAAFFDVPALVPPVLGVVGLGVLGFAAVATVFGAMAVNTRAKEVMLPALLFPVLVPLIIATVKATGLVMGGQPWEAVRPWGTILVGFDLLFLVVSFLVYEYVIEDWG
jgi:heme exporter protein B